MVLSDSLIYAALHYQLSVVNVARPREPEVVGEVGLPERSRNLFVRDTFAYVAQGYTGLIIYSIADPTAPYELGRYSSVRSTHGIWVEDTLAYIAEFDSGLTVVSVARPQTPYKIGSHPTVGWAYDVLVHDDIAYLACRDGIRVFDVSNPHMPLEVGFRATPNYAWRLTYSAPYLYIAFADAGIGIYETYTIGIEEAQLPVRKTGPIVRPSPARRYLHISSGGARVVAVRILDAAGRVVLHTKGGPSETIEIDISRLPAGLYFAELISADGSRVKGKFVRP